MRAGLQRHRAGLLLSDAGAGLHLELRQPEIRRRRSVRRWKPQQWRWVLCVVHQGKRLLFHLQWVPILFQHLPNF